MSDVTTELANEANDKTMEIERLKSDNAKLRNEVDNLLDFEHLTSVAVAYAGCDECGEYKQTMLRLFAENAKLRELVRELWAQAEQNLVCDENCPYGATCNWMDSDVVCVFRRRMRELGVEVDG